MHYKRIFTVTLFIVFVSFGHIGVGADFDALLEQAVADKQAEWEIYEGEIERIDTQFEQLWQQRKAEIEQKWKTALRSTNKEWVEYNPSFDARSSVNFEDGFVEVTAVVPVKQEDITSYAEDLIGSQIENIFSDNNVSGQNVLKDQAVFNSNEVVTSENVSSFAETVKKTTKKVGPSFVPKDNIERVAISVRFDLLPNHLETRARKYYDIVSEFSSRFKVRPEFILAVIHTESYFNPLAVSPANAHGLMQLIPKYGARDAYRKIYQQDKIVAPDYLYVPRNNVELGTAYLALLRDGSFNKIENEVQRTYLTICAYNWGPGSIKRKIIDKYDIDSMAPSQLYQVLRSHTPKETSDYLERVTKRMQIYSSNK